MRFSSSLWKRTDLSLVLNFFLISFIKPIFAANSFIRRRPASEDKSPPLKFILICLLHSRLKVFKILVKDSFRWYFLISHLNFTTESNPFLFTYWVKCNIQLKYSNSVAFSHFHHIVVNNSGIVINNIFCSILT